MNELAIRYGEGFKAQARLLADKLNLAIDESAQHYLIVDSNGLAIQSGDFKPLQVDFVAGKLAYRLSQAGKKQALAKACLIKDGPVILDISAGWGRDAAILASLGAKVTMLERNTIQALLLEDGLRRLQLNENDWQLSLIQADAIDYLQQLSDDNLPDIIYFDPMHPIRTKSAKVKKELQVLQLLIGEDEDKEQVATLALTKAAKRLVIKWPATAKPLLAQAANVSYRGKTIRYDVYFYQQ